MKSKQNKKNNRPQSLVSVSYLIGTISVIIFLVLMITGRFKPTQIITPIESRGTKIASTILDEIIQKVSTNPDLSTLSMKPLPFRLWWISDDDFNIIVEKGKNTSFEFKSSDNPVSSQVKKEMSNTLHNMVKNIMEKNGLAINDKNSSPSTEHVKFYDYIQAYEGNSIICTVLTNGDFFRLEVYCGNIEEYKSAYSHQTPFLKALNMKGEKGGVVEGIIIKNDEVAVMSIRGRRTGATAYVYKNNLYWQPLIISQAIPLCKEFEKKNIPEKYWIKCFNNQNELKPNGSAWQ